MGELLCLGLELILPHLCNGKSAPMVLLMGLIGHAACAGTGADRKSLAGEPGLDHTADNIEHACLHNGSMDGLRTMHANVDNILEGEAEVVCSGMVEAVSGVVWGEHGGRHESIFGHAHGGRTPYNWEADSGDRGWAQKSCRRWTSCSRLPSGDWWTHIVVDSI